MCCAAAACSRRAGDLVFAAGAAGGLLGICISDSPLGST